MSRSTKRKPQGSDSNPVLCYRANASHPQKYRELRQSLSDAHMLDMYFYNLSSQKEKPAALNMDFLPPTVNNSLFHFLIQRELPEQKEDKSVAGREKVRVQLPSPFAK